MRKAVVTGIITGLAGVAISGLAFASEKALEQDPLLTDGSALDFQMPQNLPAPQFNTDVIDIESLMEEHFSASVPRMELIAVQAPEVISNDSAVLFDESVLASLEIVDYVGIELATPESDNRAVSADEQPRNRPQASRVSWTSPWVGSHREDELSRTRDSVHERESNKKEVSYVPKILSEQVQN